jgi:hypothetical protein
MLQIVQLIARSVPFALDPKKAALEFELVPSELESTSRSQLQFE